MAQWKREGRGSPPFFRQVRLMTNVSKTEHAGKVEHRHLSIDDARGELAMRLAAILDVQAPMRLADIPSMDATESSIPFVQVIDMSSDPDA